MAVAGWHCSEPGPCPTLIPPFPEGLPKKSTKKTAQIPCATTPLQDLAGAGWMNLPAPLDPLVRTACSMPWQCTPESTSDFPPDLEAHESPQVDAPPEAGGFQTSPFSYVVLFLAVQKLQRPTGLASHEIGGADLSNLPGTLGAWQASTGGIPCNEVPFSTGVERRISPAGLSNL
jgi:hypothetical protein